MSDPNEKPGWFNQPANIDKLIKALYVACALAVLPEILDKIFGWHMMHPHYAIEKIPGFYGIVGFVAFVVIVRGGEVLRRLIKRDEGYYDQ
jgi:hypothetical protein